MKLVHSQFLPRQATLNKYYAISTGVDCNPYNGAESAAVYSTVKQIISERATIADETCIRIYDNEPGFGLARFDALGNDIETQILLFSVDGGSDGWNTSSLGAAFKLTNIPTKLRPMADDYSLSMFSSSGAATFQIYLFDETLNDFKKLDRRHVHISSDYPTEFNGRVNDFRIVINNSKFMFFLKTNTGWKDLTELTAVTDGNSTAPSSMSVWVQLNSLTAQQANEYGWKSEKIPVVVSTSAPIDTSIIWYHPSSNKETVFTNVQGQWKPCNLSAHVVRDNYTWFSGGVGTTFSIMDGTDALGGANLTLNPSAGGGAVEVYRINTDPSNLVGTAKKLVLDADAPDPYVVGADTETVHLRVNQSVVQIVESAYVLDVKPVSSRETVTVVKDTKGVVTAFESTTSSVEVSVSWVRKQGDYVSIPTINGTKVIPDQPQGTTGKLQVNFSGTSMNVVFNTNTSTVKTKLISAPTYVSSSTVSYEKGTQTHAKVNDKVKLVITTTEPVQEVEFTQDGKYTVDNIQYNGNIITATLINVSSALADSYDLVYRVRKTGGVWTSDISYNIVNVDNVLPVFSGMTITAPANITAVRSGSSVTVVASVSNTTGDIVPTFVASVGGDSATVSAVTQGSNSVSFSLTPHVISSSQLAIKLETTRVRNNAVLSTTAMLDVISTVAAIIPSTVNLRSGMTNVVNIPFNQTVRLTSVAFNQSDVSITKQPVATPQTSLSVEAEIINNHVPSSTVYNMTWNVVGMSGIPATLFQPYTISGFAPKTLTLTYPATIVDIGTTITDLTKLTVHGQINSDPAFPIALERVATPAELLFSDQYCVTDGGTKIQVAEQVKAFYYNDENNITLTIEQQ